MPIPLSDLTHKATLKIQSGTSSRDSYGNVINTETTMEIPCFFDMPKQKASLTVDGEEKVVEAVLFLLPSCPVKLKDKIIQVMDAFGNVVDSTEYRIGKVHTGMDGQEAHHKEAYLITSI